MAARMDVVPARQRVDVGVLLALRLVSYYSESFGRNDEFNDLPVPFFISVNTTNVEFYA